MVLKVVSLACSICITWGLTGMHISRPRCKPTASETAGSQEEGVKQGEGSRGGKYGRNPDAL